MFHHRSGVLSSDVDIVLCRVEIDTSKPLLQRENTDGALPLVGGQGQTKLGIAGDVAGQDDSVGSTPKCLLVGNDGGSMDSCCYRN